METAWVLFETTGLMGLELASVGWGVFCLDILNQDATRDGVNFVGCDLDSFDPGWLPAPGLIISFAPCTDLAVSGARWWGAKRAKDPLFQDRAEARARLAERLGDRFSCPWMLENPVGALSSRWRKPDVYFHPYEYGGYCEGPHPLYPDIYPPPRLIHEKNRTMDREWICDTSPIAGGCHSWVARSPRRTGSA